MSEKENAAQEEVKEEETKEETEEVKENELTLEEIKAAIDKLRDEFAEEIKDLEARYEEILENMTEEEKENASFEDFLRFLFDEAKRKKKYPYYPYYPYPEPKKKKKEAEEAEELPLGEGSVQTEEPSELDKLRERMEKVAEALRTQPKVEEQWAVPIAVTDNEIIGHVREFLRVDKQLMDKPGDTINIGYVNDLDFGDFGTYGSATLANAAGTSVLATTSASVVEAGLYFYVPKKDIEVIDGDVLAKINDMVRRAALRAEDKYILDRLRNAATIGLDKIEAGVDFDADWIAELISEFQKAGKQVNPGDIVLFISPEMHEALLKDIAGSVGLTFARPDIAKNGRIEEFMGVTIRVVSTDMLPGVSQTAALQQRCAVALLKGRGTVFAPKRELLVETDKDPIERRTLFVATTALAFGLVDTNCAAYITTQVVP